MIKKYFFIFFFISYIAVKILFFCAVSVGMVNLEEDLFLSIHVFITLLTLLYVLIFERKKHKVVFILFIDLFLPIYGLFGFLAFFLVSLVLKSLYHKQGVDAYDLPSGEAEFSFYEEEKKSLLSKQNEKELEDQLFDSYQIEPYIDIIESDRKDLKLNAIEKLSNIQDKQSVYLLKKALEDESYEVRYFANNALEKIEKTIILDIEAVSESIQRHPSEISNYNSRAYLYMSLFKLKILDDATAKFFLEKALYDLLFSIQLDTKQSVLYVKTVEIYIMLKQYKKAEEAANQALKLNLSPDDRGKVLFYLAEAKFHRSEHLEVINICKELKDYKTPYKLINESANWWGGFNRE